MAWRTGPADEAGAILAQQRFQVARPQLDLLAIGLQQSRLPLPPGRFSGLLRHCRLPLINRWQILEQTLRCFAGGSDQSCLMVSQWQVQITAAKNSQTLSGNPVRVDGEWPALWRYRPGHRSCTTPNNRYGRERSRVRGVPGVKGGRCADAATRWKAHRESDRPSQPHAKVRLPAGNRRL